MKKSLALAMAGIMAFSTNVSVFAAERISDSAFVHSSTANTSRKLTSTEILQYNEYELTFPEQYTETEDQNIMKKDGILEMCTADNNLSIGSMDIQIYTSDNLSQYLYNCKELTEISEINGSIYISYISNDNENVVLQYDEDGLVDKAIYDDSHKNLVYISDNEALIEQTNTYTMSEELQNYIDICIEKGEISTLKDNPNLTVLEENGSYIVEEKLPFEVVKTNGNVSLLSTIPTSNSELLTSLKKDFPLQTKAVVDSASKKCDELEKYVSVMIKQDRNTYSRSHADWKTFAVGTTVTAIASYIGGPTTAAVAVLNVIGIGISTSQTILSEVDLCKSAVYSFKGNRYGYVFDTTKYNANVLVKSTKSSGKFTGGFNKNGDFTWIISSVPLAYEDSTSEWINTTITWYNNDLKLGTGVTTFQPD